MLFCQSLTLFCHVVIELNSCISVFANLNLILFPYNPIYFLFFQGVLAFPSKKIQNRNAKWSPLCYLWKIEYKLANAVGILLNPS